MFNSLSKKEMKVIFGGQKEKKLTKPDFIATSTVPPTSNPGGNNDDDEVEVGVDDQ